MLGITGTGGSGKSSLTDELVRRFRLDQQDKLRIAVLAVDPTRRTRRRRAARRPDPDELARRRPGLLPLAWPPAARHELPEHLADVIAVLKAAGFDLVIVETPGIGQGDAAIVPFVDTSLYVMTPEFGAASQLEKIDMLDFADVVAINKFERRGAKDALRDVGRQLVRNREAFGKQPEDMPVFGTSAATFNDDGVTALYQHLRGAAGRARPAPSTRARCPASTCGTPPGSAQVVPADRVRYLAEIAETVRGYHAETERAGRRRRAGCSGSTPSPASWLGRRRRRRRRRAARAGAQDAARTSVADQIDELARGRRVVLRRRAGRRWSGTRRSTPR